jgi:hypothetical protein
MAVRISWLCNVQGCEEAGNEGQVVGGAGEETTRSFLLDALTEVGRYIEWPMALLWPSRQCDSWCINV